jgi:hypothetical protein
MSTITAIKSKNRPTTWPDVDRQIQQGKAVLRELRDTLEDLDDRRELARAKKRNGAKPGTNWETVKKEFGFDF